MRKEKGNEREVISPPSLLSLDNMERETSLGRGGGGERMGGWSGGMEGRKHRGNNQRKM